jgi:hypothetical protein
MPPQVMSDQPLTATSVMQYKNQKEEERRKATQTRTANCHHHICMPHHCRFEPDLPGLMAALPGPEEAYLQLALTMGRTEDCSQTPTTFLRDMTSAILTLIGTDLITTATAFRVLEFDCSDQIGQSGRKQREIGESSALTLEYRITTTDAAQTLEVLDRAAAFLKPQASGLNGLDLALAAGSTEFSLTGTVVGSVQTTATGDAGACETSEWAPWSTCSIAICGPGVGYQANTRTCPLESTTRVCPTVECGDCTVNHGGCGANAVCTLDLKEQVICTCDQDLYIGTGVECENRTAVQEQITGFEVQYSVPLSSVAPVVQDESALIKALTSNLAAAFGVSPDRLAAAAVRPVTEHSFMFSVLVLEPNLLTEPNAAEMEALFATAAVFKGFQIQYGEIALLPIATESYGRTYDMLFGAASQATGDHDAFARFGGDVSASASDDADANSWSRTDTVHLLAVWVALSFVLLAGFEYTYYRARRTNELLQTTTGGGDGGGEKAGGAGGSGKPATHFRDRDGDGDVDLSDVQLAQANRASGGVGWSGGDTPDGFSPNGYLTTDFEPWTP